MNVSSVKPKHPDLPILWAIQNALLVFCVLGMLLVSQQGLADQTLTVYSSRKTHLIQPLLDQFTAETGIKTALLTGKPKQLLARLKAEGRRTPADVLVTVDAGNLYAAKNAGLLQPVVNSDLQAAVPAHLRDNEHYWYGLSKRMRVIVYAPDRVKASEVTSYNDLAKPRFKGRVCVRGSGNIYNQSLLASIIANQGKIQAEVWADGVVKNLARAPKGNDRAQIVDIADGVCDVSIANTYYVGIMKTNSKNKKQQAAVEKVALSFPNADATGTHVNVSGIAMIKASTQKKAVDRLMTFLVGAKAQQWYAQKNNEYPVRAGVAASQVVQDFGGNIKEDMLPMGHLGKYNREAVVIFDKVGWQ